jgi:rhodanese-related sulfurtransferase
MRRILVASVCLSGALGCGSGNSGNAPVASSEEDVEHFARISVGEVATALAEHRVAVFDANDRETFDERHVPGATWVDYDGVTREQLPTDTSSPLVFYCYNEACSASHVAAESAIAMGF